MPDDLSPENHFDTFEEFREQAAQYFGFAADMTLAGFTITHPQALSEEQQEAYDNLRIYVEDSEELMRNPNGSAKEPMRTKAGKRVSYDELLAKVWLGDKYPEFRAAGGRDIDVSRATTKMNRDFLARRRADLKSNNSTGSSA